MHSNKIFYISSEEFSSLFANLVKIFALQKSKKKSKSPIKDIWSKFIKENSSVLKEAMQQRKLLYIYQNFIVKSELYSHYPISYEYFRRLIKELI